jgi:hypothetical protein
MTRANLQAVPALPVDQAEAVAELVAETAGTYSRMAAELADMIEAEAARSANTLAAVRRSLDELRAALDALTREVAR